MTHPMPTVVPAVSFDRPRRVSSSALDLLAQARRGLVEATQFEYPAERYATAHLAALRASAAVLADRAQPTGPMAGEVGFRAGHRGRHGTGRSAGSGSATVRSLPARRRRLRSAWELLSEVAPELSEWADFFAAGAAKRAAAEAGVRSAATERDADDLIRDVETFVAVVMTTLGLPAPAVGQDPLTAAGSAPSRPAVRLAAVGPVGAAGPVGPTGRVDAGRLQAGNQAGNQAGKAARTVHRAAG